MALGIANSARLRGLALGGALTACFGIPHARADAQADAERAQALFDDARALMKQANYAEACPKFAQSQALDPGGGTLLNLGICHAQEGRTATAFKELNQALALARSEGRADRERTAQKHLDELGPELCKLTMQARPGASLQGSSLELDGAPLDPALLGSAIPVDPGPHQIRAFKPGYKPWSIEITIAPVRDQYALEIPPLELEAASASPPASPRMTSGPSPAAEPARAPQTSDVSLRAATPPRVDARAPRWPGLVTLSIGAAAVGVGSYFGVRALMLKSASNDHFDGTKCTEQSCANDWTAAKKAALESTVSFAVGLAALGVGAYFEWAAANGARAAQGLRIRVAGTSSGAALAAQTEF